MKNAAGVAFWGCVAWLTVNLGVVVKWLVEVSELRRGGYETWRQTGGQAMRDLNHNLNMGALYCFLALVCTLILFALYNSLEEK